MKTILTILLWVLFIFYGLGTRIEFKPFRLHFDSWVYFVGLLLTILGVLIVYYEGYRSGLRRGRENTVQTLTQTTNDRIQSNGKIEY